MKIGVTSTGPNLIDNVETRFGRCAYFLIVDPDTMEFEAVENLNVALGGGAGIQSAQLMSDKGVRAVLTGHCGPNAFQVLGAAGIEVVVGVSGQVQSAVDRYRQGALTSAPKPNVGSHFGIGAGDPGAGVGVGQGSGMGQGMGRGRGRGGGMGPVDPGAGAPTVLPTGELEPLRAEARALEEQLRAINERIAGLKGRPPHRALIAVVDRDLCVACDVCGAVCPVDAICVNDVAEVDPEKCTGCARCVAECPRGALSLLARS